MILDKLQNSFKLWMLFLYFFFLIQGQILLIIEKSNMETHKSNLTCFIQEPKIWIKPIAIDIIPIYSMQIIYFYEYYSDQKNFLKKDYS